MSITPLTTSPPGRSFLRREEGCVLRAYRDVTGTWTIGDGLTAASGVVTPRAGMVITQDEADRLFVQALARSYEPAVRKAMPGAKQHEFDAGISFHWNTGAIASASWVGLWKQRKWSLIPLSMGSWNKSKGKVIPGLTRRREREAALLRHGDYGAGIAIARTADMTYASVSSALSSEDMQEARAGLAKLGYPVGADANRIHRVAVTRFQKDHDLTVDGILGRATLATIRRMASARASGTAAAGAGLGAMAGAGVSDATAWFDAAVLGGAGLFALYVAWTYRDAISAAVQFHAPRLAALLRRF